MKSIQLLDASLRDGGHRTNFHFSDKELEGILLPLDKTGVEYIEIGYRNGSLHPIDNLGRAGFCEKNYLHLCRSLIKKSAIAVMAHPNNITDPDLVELKDLGISLLRVCIAKDTFTEAIPIIKIAKKLNFQISINFIHMTYYTDEELDEVVEQASKYQPDMI